MKRLEISKAILLAAGGFCLAGCASVPENILHSRYRETYDTVYKTPDTEPAQVSIDEKATFADYLQHALAHNPGVRAAFERWKAALERIPQTRSLSDPSLAFEYFIEQKDQRYQLSLTQLFPAFGTLPLRDRQAVATAEAAMHAFQAERFTLLERLSRAFYDYHYLSRATAVTQEHLHLLAELEEVVTARYQSDTTSFAELIKLQIEKARLANEQVALQEQRGAQSAALASLLGLPGGKPLPWPRVAPFAPAAIDEEALAGMLATLNPELQAADRILAAARHGEQLAARSFRPSLMLGVGWMVMAGMDGRGNESDWGIMAGINIPLWRGKYRAAVREAGALARSAASRHDELRNQLSAELSMAIFKFRDAERRVALFENTLTPKAEQALEVAKREFAAGKTEFMTLIDAQRTLLEFGLLAERAAADRQIALDDIGCCVGIYTLETASGRQTPNKLEEH